VFTHKGVLQLLFSLLQQGVQVVVLFASYFLKQKFAGKVKSLKRVMLPRLATNGFSGSFNVSANGNILPYLFDILSFPSVVCRY
jgi:hypothetical protein